MNPVKYRCTVCGYIQEGELPEGFICPVCKSPASAFVKVEEKSEVDDKDSNKSESSSESSNKYKGTKTEKNLMDALAGESIARINIHSLQR